MTNLSICSIISCSWCNTGKINFTLTRRRPKTGRAANQILQSITTRTVTINLLLPVLELLLRRLTTLQTRSLPATASRKDINTMGMKITNSPNAKELEIEDPSAQRKAQCSRSIWATYKKMGGQLLCSGISRINTRGIWFYNKSTLGTSKKNTIFSTFPSITGYPFPLI